MAQGFHPGHFGPRLRCERSISGSFSSCSTSLSSFESKNVELEPGVSGTPRILTHFSFKSLDQVWPRLLAAHRSEESVGLVLDGSIFLYFCKFVAIYVLHQTCYTFNPRVVCHSIRQTALYKATKKTKLNTPYSIARKPIPLSYCSLIFFYLLFLQSSRGECDEREKKKNFQKNSKSHMYIFISHMDPWPNASFHLIKIH